MSANFREWNTSTPLIHALHSGALAWIEQWETPTVESLHLLTAFIIGMLAKTKYNFVNGRHIEFYKNDDNRKLLPSVETRYAGHLGPLKL
jgi:hypothetical protein